MLILPLKFGTEENSELWEFGFLFLKILFMYLFLERGEEREKHRPVASCMTPTGDLAHTQACALTQESNPSSLWADVQSIETRQPGQETSDKFLLWGTLE